MVGQMVEIISDRSPYNGYRGRVTAANGGLIGISVLYSPRGIAYRNYRGSFWLWHADLRAVTGPRPCGGLGGIVWRHQLEIGEAARCDEVMAWDDLRSKLRRVFAEVGAAPSLEARG